VDFAFFRSHPKTSKNAIYGTQKANNGGFGIGSNNNGSSLPEYPEGTFYPNTLPKAKQELDYPKTSKAGLV